MRKPDRLFLFLGPPWLACLTFVQVWSWRHDGEPGPAAEPPRSWSAGSRLGGPGDRGTLLMFVADACPCSRAGLRELERLLAEVPEGRRPQALVVFVGPESESDGASWSAASAIGGARALRDGAGDEARRFGARTSGQVMFYHPSGILGFEGGLTIARGHEGESSGRAALRRRIGGETSPMGRAPVFGCPLPIAEDRGRTGG